jgi:hypothetical protein
MAIGKCLTMTALIERGWTRSMITKLLGEPDDLADNPYYRSGAPTKLYAMARIEAAEASREFAAAAAKAAMRSERSQKAADVRRESLLRQVEAMEVKVVIVPAEELTQRACIAYRKLWASRGKDRDASPGDDPDFIARITMNYIRHKLTTYDYVLEQIAGQVGVQDAVDAIQRKVYAAIADAYPQLFRRD